MLKEGDASGWVMNECMDTCVHVSIRGWKDAVSESMRGKGQSCGKWQF